MVDEFEQQVATALDEAYGWADPFKTVGQKLASWVTAAIVAAAREAAFCTRPDHIGNHGTHVIAAALMALRGKDGGDAADRGTTQQLRDAELAKRYGP